MMTATSDLPKYNPVSGIGRRETRKLRSIDKRIHFIPLIVILCFIILWIYGSKLHRGDIIIEDEKNDDLTIKETIKPESVKESHVRVDLASLSLARNMPMNASTHETPYQAMPQANISLSALGQLIEPDKNAGSSVSLSFGSRKVLLIQKGNVTIKDEKINKVSEIKKSQSIEEPRTDFASAPQPLSQESAEIVPLQGRSGDQK